VAVHESWPGHSSSGGRNPQPSQPLSARIPRAHALGQHVRKNPKGYCGRAITFTLGNPSFVRVSSRRARSSPGGSFNEKVTRLVAASAWIESLSTNCRV